LSWGLVDQIAEDLEAAFAVHWRRLRRMDRRAIGSIKRLAAHFSVAANYFDDAASEFCRLLDSAETQARIARFVAGDSPWLDGSEQSGDKDR